MAKPKKRPEPSPVHRTTVDLPHALYRALKIRALDEGRPFRDVVIDALTRYLRIHKGGAS